ncbi:hypothetical protein DENIS_1901 [Desulfonema ishimotonii]|uniref:Glycosyltransferase RgtA/B/C/D-like domain-containing protein n=1 Tax=Desulfonema ishimotonii TaxID=45657 RepID=A0A401FVF6_9BACT|nr:glycosyltransferase family 39 protein [Desulfonema ishimotonii]GBC60941.1 hypothetical protein DENIS_1901 [Desulfonema ishimotonii]
MNRKDVLLAAILCLSFILRIYDLGGESIWLDEGYSVSFAKMKTGEIFCLQDTNPPLYYMILHWWIGIFGTSEFSIRFPSVIFGVLSVGMMFVAGKQLFDEETGVLAALLMGISAFHVYYSQEARTYSFLVFLTLASMFFFVNLIRRNRISDLAGYVLFSVLLVYAHIYGSFVVLAQNLYVILLGIPFRKEARGILKKWVVGQVAVAGLFALWLPMLLSAMQEVHQGFWLEEPSVGAVLETMMLYSGHLLFLPYIFLAVFSIFSCEKIRRKRGGQNIFQLSEGQQWRVRTVNMESAGLLWVWLIIPLMVPVVISRISTPIYHTRYAISSSVALYLLVAGGIVNIRHRRIKVAVIGFIAMFSLLYVVKTYIRVDKEPWRDVAKYVDMNAKDGDLVLFNRERCLDLTFDYYSGKKGLVKKPFPRDTRFVNAENIRELGPAVGGFDRVWLILSHTGDRQGLIVRHLFRAYAIRHHGQYNNIDLYFFEALPDIASGKEHSGRDTE